MTLATRPSLGRDVALKILRELSTRTPTDAKKSS
jgi:hypothetical protein